jgi:phospholipid transport system substrate-binding protein
MMPIRKMPIRNKIVMFLLFCFTSVGLAEDADTAAASKVVTDFQSVILNVMQQGDKLTFEQRFDIFKLNFKTLP